MHMDMRLGRVGGVEVGINWSWLIVVALVTWSLAAQVFPVTNKGHSPGTYLAMALVATILYFASLLLHELAHALQARHEGMEVSGITLWVFGGVARFSGMFPSAGAEFRIAIAGPLVTLVLGAAFLAAATLISLPATVDGVVSWLGRMNLFLFAFNMLPALPLDGGRVLHSVLWKVRGSSAWATAVAGRLGQLFGYLMIVGGTLMALFVELASGLWLALIGWFLVTAAGAETGTVAAREALTGLHVSDAMVRHPVTVRGDQTLRDVVDQVLSESHYTSYPVTENSHALGLLPSAEVVAVPADSLAKVLVRDRMIPADRTLTLADRDDLGEALAALLQTDLRRALVVDHSELVGLLSITDVRRLLELHEH
jgi:Zn-dependent protease/CBS domain-containing protein